MDQTAHDSSRSKKGEIALITEFRYLSSIVLIMLFITGCMTAAPQAKKTPVFFPEPPAPARIQFLTSYTGSKDIEPEKSGFDKFITGENEKASRLDKPYGIAMHKGKIYVCDTNRTVMVFDLEKKTFGTLAGAQGLGKLVQPLNISIDRDGNKFVADPVRGQVVEFDKNDFYVKSYGMAGGDWKPVDAAPYEDLLYVADIKNTAIKIFDRKTGELVNTIGQDEGLGKLVMPTNIAFDREGYLYVSDAGRFQIVKLDRDGHARGVIGQLGSQPSSFARPKGIAMDREDRLYAVDAAFDNIQVFNHEGKLLLFFGRSGTRPGDLYLPAKVSIDYENAKYFEHYADPNFQIEYVILVTSQFGERLVNVFGFGREKGRQYQSDEELMMKLKEKELKFKEEHADKTTDGEKSK